MGWSSETKIVEKVISAVEDKISSESEKYHLYQYLIKTFDWDNLDEVIGQSSAFDKAAAKLFPEAFGGIE